MQLLLWMRAGIARSVWWLWYGTNDLGFKSWQGQEILLCSIISRPALGLTQPPIQWVPVTVAPRVKQPECEVYHSPPSCPKVKNERNSTSVSSCIPPWRAQGQLYLCLFTVVNRCALSFLNYRTSNSICLQVLLWGQQHCRLLVAPLNQISQP